MEELIPNPGNCLASRKLLEEDGHILWAWREKPLMPSDSGWRFLSDKDTDLTVLPEERMLMVSLNEIFEIEPMVAGIYWYPIGADFQFFSQVDNKHFVYNDSFDKVELASSLDRVPSESEVFKAHFPQYKPPKVSGKQEKVLIARVPEIKPAEEKTKAAAQETTEAKDLDNDNKRDQASKHTYIPSIDDTVTLSGAELKLLADAKEEVEGVLKLWQSELKDQPDNNELYVITGLLLGYLGIRNIEVPLEWATRRNLIVNTFYQTYQVSQEKTKLYIESYENRRDNPKFLAEIQIIRYGRAMYEWYWQNNTALIKEQFGHLIDHYTD